MPNIIPPIVSYSPPPLDPVDDDDDDEFGDFTTADIPNSNDAIGPKNSFDSTWKPHSSNPPQDEFLLQANGLPSKAGEPAPQSSLPAFDVQPLEENSQQAPYTSPNSAVSTLSDPANSGRCQNSNVPSPMPHSELGDDMSVKMEEKCSSQVFVNDCVGENLCQDAFESGNTVLSELENLNGLVIMPELNTPPSKLIPLCQDGSSDLSNPSNGPEALHKIKFLDSHVDVSQQSMPPANVAFQESSNIDPVSDNVEIEHTSLQCEKSSDTHSSSESFLGLKPIEKAVDSEEDESVKAMIVPDVTIISDDVGDTNFYKHDDSHEDIEDSDLNITEFDSPSRRPTLVLVDELTEPEGSQLSELPLENNKNFPFQSQESEGHVTEEENLKNSTDSSEFSKDHVGGCVLDHCSDNDSSEFADFTQVQDAFNAQADAASFSAQFDSEDIPKEWAQDSILDTPRHTAELDEFDDFNDFESAEFKANEPEMDKSSTSMPSLEFNSTRERIESVFKELFPLGDGSEELPEVEQSFCTGSGVSGIVLDVEDSPVWQGLRDLESTPSLSFQWPGSHSNRSLLGSLNIDSRNILFGPKWNTVVPRFAANLGFSPLEPVRAVQAQPAEQPTDSDNVPQVETISRVTLSSSTDTVPAAQFDWNDSGLVNPLDSVKDQSGAALATTFTSGNPALVSPQLSVPSSVGEITVQDPKLSPEASRILNNLPELAFLSARMLMFPVQSDTNAHKL